MQMIQRFSRGRLSLFFVRIFIGCLIVTWVGALLCSAAGKPRYASLILTDSKETKAEKSVFATDTPKIYVLFTLADAPSGTPVRAVWIADQTGGAAPDNYKIDEASLNAGGNITAGNFSMSKPNKGWPVGKYHVELYISGGLAQKIPFRVAK